MLPLWKIVTSFSLCVGALAFSSPSNIVIKGDPTLEGVNLASLEAYRFTKKKQWLRVPLQIDEVNARGDYVLEEGLPFTKNSDNGLYDDNDELVLARTDFGESFTKKMLSKEMREQGRRFFRIKLGSQNLLLVEKMWSSENVDWEPKARFDSEQKSVETANYRYLFNAESAAVLGEVFIKKAGKLVKIFKESFFSIALRTPWFMPNILLDRDSFESTVESWQVGAHRAIIAVGVKYRSFLSLFDFHLFSELVFYNDALQIPTIIEFPFSPNDYLKEGTGIAYSIDIDEAIDWRIDSNLTDLPQAGPDAYPDLKSNQEHYEVKASTSVGDFVVKVRIDERAASVSPPPFVFSNSQIASKTFKNNWLWMDSLSGDLGVFIDFSGVSKGSYDFGLDLVLHSEAHESESSGSRRSDTERASISEITFQ